MEGTCTMARKAEFLTSQEVVKMLDVDLNYLNFLRRSGKLLPVEQKTIRVKPRLRYRRSDVEAFIHKREQEKEAHFSKRVAVA